MQGRPLQTFALKSYRAGYTVLLSLGAALTLPILLCFKKRRETLFKRFGWQRYPEARNHVNGPIWVHALSVGEVLSAVNLIKQLHSDLKGRPLYLSVSTLSGHSLAREKLTGHIDGLFYFPYDVSYAVKRVLNRIRPALFILVETDIWPGFLSELRRRRIPAILVNGRLSPESFGSYTRLRFLFEPAFNSFYWVFPQSKIEADRFRALGLEPHRIRRCGNLKFDVADGLPTSNAVQELRTALNLSTNHPVLVAGSTHKGEEAIIRSAYLRLRALHPSLVLILAPRHPERSGDVRALFRDDKLTVGVLSQTPPRDTAVILVDQMGYLARLYALGDLAFVGGSLVPQGGHNPIEPACHGKPVLFGPDMHDFPDVARWLIEAGGAIQVKDEHAFFETCDVLLSDRSFAGATGEKARRVVEQNQGTTRKIVEEITGLVGEQPGPG